MTREAQTHGFTLAELLATLAVLGICLAIAVPAFAGLQRRAGVASVQHLLTSSLAIARLAAVKYGTPVSVCPSSDGLHCRDEVIWSAGWIVYADPERDEQPASASAVLQRVEGVGASLALRTTSGRKRVRFFPSGWAWGSNLSLRLCTRGSGHLLGKVVVNNAGRPRSERYPAGTEPCPYHAAPAPT